LKRCILHTFGVLAISSLVLVVSANAQEIAHMHGHPVLISIEDAREAGSLSNDEAILQMYYAAYRPEMLDNQFRTGDDNAPIKCMVPVALEFGEMRSELKPSTIDEINLLMSAAATDTELSYLSPSGRFMFHYETTGPDAVPDDQTLPGAIEEGIPDYIYKAAFAADSSYRYQVEQLGFSDFSKADPYDIRFDNFGFYGTTTSSGSTSYITLHNTFFGFPENSHPEGKQIGALYVTIAHEIKHAIQYEANRWRGSAGSFNWIEMDATLMEEVVFDDVNDYYNYIKTGFESAEPSFTSIFGRPQNPTPGAYYHITWMLYFTEVYGMDFWVDVWDEVSADPLIPFIDAIDGVLRNRAGSFSQDHLRNHLWHMGSGEGFTDADFGFEERQFYPASVTEGSLLTVPDSLSQMDLRPLGANYIRANSPNISIGRPGIRLESTSPGVGIGVIGLFTDGSSRSQIFLNELVSTQQIQTEWDWNELNDFYIAVVNTNRSQSADYKLIIESVIPEKDILARNYPNPFNPSTRIEFALNSPKNVRLDIFDSIGRRVETLINGRLNEGIHFVDFDGSGLSSGVYFYRIRTNDQTLTQKMVLVK
jgi:hypothetical protein